MNVEVILFAGLREKVNSDRLALELPDDASYAELKHQLAAQFPSLAPLIEVSRIATGTEFAEEDSTIDPAADLAIIPPVSGG